MKYSSAIGVAVVAALLTVVPYIYSQEAVRHTPNFPYMYGISIDEILKNMTILSILNQLANRSIDYREAVEALQKSGVVDYETVDRLIAVYNTTGEDVLNRVGDPQLNELIEELREGNLGIEELRDILNYMDYLYATGALDLLNYIALLNMVSNLYSERGLEIPADVTDRVYYTLTTLLTRPYPFLEIPQHIDRLPEAETSTSLLPLAVPKTFSLPSIGTSIPLEALVALAVTTCMVLAIVFRDVVATIFNRIRRGIDRRILLTRLGSSAGKNLDPVAIYWSATRIVERTSKIRRGECTTHREYLNMLDRVRDLPLYSLFARITQLYELYRFGFRKGSDIVDEANRVFNNMVEMYGER